ncbi:MAG: PilZ domain-containing protein [Proteobacteria bacterium]|nr:PilZ domain-containing protein [Pseudomonadota bacterium]
MSSNKRIQERFSLNLQAKISYRHSEDHLPVIDTVAANISSGGAFLRTPHPFPMAAKVRVEFLLSFDDVKRLKFILSVESLKNLTGKSLWVSATAIVIRQETDGVGIIFDTDYQFTPMRPPQPEK